MKALFDNNKIDSLQFEKNGKRLDISYVTSDEDPSVAATFCVGVTVDDFCSLFDLTYEIDKQGRKILFTS